MRVAWGGALLALLLAGCAAHNAPTTERTVPAHAVGQPANVSYGTIVAERPVTVSGESDGAGAPVGAAAGGTAGSFIGGDVRSRILAAIGGAVPGGLAGTEIHSGVASGSATEFIIREDDGSTISVVQSNGLRFVPGERVMIVHGAMTRLAAAAES